MPPGGTPSVRPVTVIRCAGRPPTMTIGDDPPGRVDTTTVHGFVTGVGGWAQPTIGAPTRSPSHKTGAPPAVTVVWRGVRSTCPPWTQIIRADDVSSGINRLS